MDYINYVLNDESNNDKQLVKELSIYVRNHAKNRLPIDRTFVKNAIDIILRNSEIDYNMIDFNIYCDYATWSKNDGILEFNVTNVLRAYDEFFKVKARNSRILSYFVILSTIIHELTHARRDYVMNVHKNEIYNSCKILIDEKYEVYDDKHDEVLTERYANLRGELLSYQVLSYIYPPRYVKFLQLSIYEYLLYGYEVKEGSVVSALDTYNSIMEENGFPKVDIDCEESLDLYSRLYLGLPITKEEYDKMLDLYVEIYDGKRQNESIKKLINEL